MPARTWRASSCPWRERGLGLGAVELPLGDGELRVDGLAGEIHAPALDLAAIGQLLGGDAGFFSSTVAMRPCWASFSLTSTWAMAGVAVALGLGKGALAFERRAFQLGAQVDELEPARR